MKYRTDLALECKEMYEAENNGVNSQVNVGAEIDKKVIPGTEIHEEKYDDDIKVSRIEIVDERGEAIFQKPRGNYITLEIDGIIDGKEGIKERASRALAKELARLIKFHYHLKVLVVGLGNDKVTPDALGPYTVSKVKITRHLFIIYEEDGDYEMGNVSGFIPGVTGSTGMETADLIKQAVDMVNPEVVVVVDSLAARNISRVNTTIQINDTGINPGSGMGNVRRELNEETLGKRVIAIGVPTVIDAGTLVIDALSGFKHKDGEIDDYLSKNRQELVVTSTDIDMVIKDFSDIIANGINITLHPGIYS